MPVGPTITIFSFLRGFLAGLTPDAEAIILLRPRLAESLGRVDEATSPPDNPEIS